MFRTVYDKVMTRAGHSKAPWILGGLSFAESSFFPVPPNVMLAPMALARPQRAWGLALLTTLTSVLGGLLGYCIGFFVFDWVEPLLHRFGYWDSYFLGRDWFVEWGFWAVFLAGFSPIPYKVFTIAAGVMSMALLLFTLASVIGRGARFFMVTGLMKWGGAPMERRLREHVDILGWLTVGAAVILYVALKH